MHAEQCARHRSLLTPAFIGAGWPAQGEKIVFLKPRESTRRSVMTIKLELVDLGDATVETRQLPILPLFIDSISSFGLLPL
jgi:hypothetical protein